MEKRPDDGAVFFCVIFSPFFLPEQRNASGRKRPACHGGELHPGSSQFTTLQWVRMLLLLMVMMVKHLFVANVIDWAQFFGIGTLLSKIAELRQ